MGRQNHTRKIEQSIGKISKSCETFPGKKSIDSEV